MNTKRVLRKITSLIVIPESQIVILIKKFPEHLNTELGQALQNTGHKETAKAHRAEITSKK